MSARSLKHRLQPRVLLWYRRWAIRSRSSAGSEVPCWDLWFTSALTERCRDSVWGREQSLMCFRRISFHEFNEKLRFSVHYNQVQSEHLTFLFISLDFSPMFCCGRSIKISPCKLRRKVKDLDRAFDWYFLPVFAHAANSSLGVSSAEWSLAASFGHGHYLSSWVRPHHTVFLKGYGEGD